MLLSKKVYQRQFLNNGISYSNYQPKKIINKNQDFNKEIDYISFEDKLQNWKRFSKEFLVNSINSLNN